MPYRVQRIEEFTKQLEAGDLKLRVRVLEVSLFISFVAHYSFKMTYISFILSQFFSGVNKRH